MLTKVVLGKHGVLEAKDDITKFLQKMKENVHAGNATIYPLDNVKNVYIDKENSEGHFAFEMDFKNRIMHLWDLEVTISSSLQN
jgi:hypothetical protein